jgi:pantoate--beta-alanine ligase
MKRVTTVKEAREHLGTQACSPKGFVPTMGALHEGHLSLVRRAVAACPVMSVSIFVNPTQFNDPDDLKKYPRTPAKDIEMLSKVMRKDDLLFMPEISEMYPEPDTRRFSFGNLEKVMEGAHRPGHFNGVGQVVSRLFDIIGPDIAYFGQKDFQQLTIIRELVRQTGSRIKIEGCPIVRESDGLAMSSRNKLLEPEIRRNAPVIFSSLCHAAEALYRTDVAKTGMLVRELVESIPGFTVEYFEIADDVELNLISSVSEMISGRKYYACIAVKAGKIRLIDNVEIPLR